MAKTIECEECGARQYVKDGVQHELHFVDCSKHFDWVTRKHEERELERMPEYCI